VLRSPPVPELPDLAILADASQAALVGRPIEQVDVREPLVVRGTPSELDALRGQGLSAVKRRGKFLVFELDRDRVVLSPMLTGRLGLVSPRTRATSKLAVVVRFGPRSGEPPAELAKWTRGADWLPAPDEQVELRYRDQTRMGKVYILPRGLDRPVPGWDELGPDADDPELDLETWRSRIRRHSGELKNLLRNQVFVAGIGNAYSDEVLWAARLAPFRKRSSLAADEVDDLYKAVREVLPWAVAELQTRVPPHFEVEIRDFLRVHRKGGRPCPRCGTPISEVAAGGFVTSFCRACQR
jgi:formamidopyrimidine-DNA glycosylase